MKNPLKCKEDKLTKDQEKNRSNNTLRLRY